MQVQKDHQSRFKTRFGPSGIHIFDRSTGANVLLDEIRIRRNLWSKAPRQISVALTNSCNLSCPYCYAPKTAAVLDFDRVVGWLEELDGHGCLGVGFGGGEPTLYPRFAELCRYAAQQTRLAVTFTTHGHQLGDRLLAALAGNVHFVRVSMDGVGATYEALRGRSFLSLLDRLKSVRALAPFGINFVVNARTLPDLELAADLAAEAGAVEFLLLPEQQVRGKGGINEITLRELRRWVDVYRGSIPLAISEVGSDGLPTCDPLAQEKGLRAFAHIDASGFLKATSYDSVGIEIGHDSVMHTLDVLRNRQGDRRQ